MELEELARQAESAAELGERALRGSEGVVRGHGGDLTTWCRAAVPEGVPAVRGFHVLDVRERNTVGVPDDRDREHRDSE